MRRSNTGMTLVEVTVAIFILLVAILPIMTLLNSPRARPRQYPCNKCSVLTTDTADIVVSLPGQTTRRVSFIVCPKCYVNVEKAMRK